MKKALPLLSPPHPTGGKAQYMGFDTSSAPKIKTEAEIRLFHRMKYLAYHLKKNTDKDKVQTENAYVESVLANQHRELVKWNNR